MAAAKGVSNGNVQIPNGLCVSKIDCADFEYRWQADPTGRFVLRSLWGHPATIELLDTFKGRIEKEWTVNVPGVSWPLKTNAATDRIFVFSLKFRDDEVALRKIELNSNGEVGVQVFPMAELGDLELQSLISTDEPNIFFMFSYLDRRSKLVFQVHKLNAETMELETIGRIYRGPMGLRPEDVCFYKGRLYFMDHQDPDPNGIGFGIYGLLSVDPRESERARFVEGIRPFELPTTKLYTKKIAEDCHSRSLIAHDDRLCVVWQQSGFKPHKLLVYNLVTDESQVCPLNHSYEENIRWSGFHEGILTIRFDVSFDLTRPRRLHSYRYAISKPEKLANLAYFARPTGMDLPLPQYLR